MRVEEIEVGKVYEFTNPSHLAWCGQRVKVARKEGNLIVASVVRVSPDAGIGTEYPVGHTVRHLAGDLSEFHVSEAEALFEE